MLSDPTDAGARRKRTFRKRFGIARNRRRAFSRDFLNSRSNIREQRFENRDHVDIAIEKCGFYLPDHSRYEQDASIGFDLPLTEEGR